jgi:hypothetical protein
MPHATGIIELPFPPHASNPAIANIGLILLPPGNTEYLIALCII